VKSHYYSHCARRLQSNLLLYPKTLLLYPKTLPRDTNAREVNGKKRQQGKEKRTLV